MDYKLDTEYKENLNKIENGMDGIMKKIKENADKIKDETKEVSEEQKKEVLGLWHHVVHSYHDTLADLKKRFDIKKDDVLEHKMKSFLHQAKEA